MNFDRVITACSHTVCLAPGSDLEKDAGTIQHGHWAGTTKTPTVSTFHQFYFFLKTMRFVVLGRFDVPVYNSFISLKQDVTEICTKQYKLFYCQN